MAFLSIDFETRSTVDLRRTGVYPYAVHPHTDLWLMGWAFEGEEPDLWFPGQPLPPRIIEHIEAGGEMRAWNAQFERVMWREVGVKRHGFIRVCPCNWVDTAAEAAAMALPRHLADAAEVCNVPQQKDAAGTRLMLQMCKPRAWKANAQGVLVPVWWDEPEKIQRLGAYCKQDVRTEQAMVNVLRRLGETERKVYLLDQRINDRGVLLDVEAVEAAKAAAQYELDEQNSVIATATNGAVERATQIAKLRMWVAEQGVETDSLDKAALKELLKGELPPDVAQALTARAEAGKSSLAKLDAMLRCRCPDDRIRGLLLYHAAHTGRWAGKLVQPQNFPRPGFDDEHYDEQVDELLGRILRGERASLTELSWLLRSMLIAPPGSRLYGVDFSGIEARVLAWVAEEQLMLDAFRNGIDPYRLMASRIYGVALAEVTAKQRQMGKMVVLGCGYGMGGDTFRKNAKDQWGVELAYETTEVEGKTVVVRDEAAEVVAAYRATNPNTKEYWSRVNRAAIRAVQNPGEVRRVGGVAFVKRGAYLWCVLPSGRPLAYAAPRIVERPLPWDAERTTPSVEYSGVNSVTRKWQRSRLYGGLITENIVQAISRDLMAEAMLRVEDAGYPVILTVHDEIVSEVPDTVKVKVPGGEQVATLAHYKSLIEQLPKWAAGCPVAASGWVGQRYRK